MWLLSILAGLSNPLFDLEGEENPLYEDSSVEELIKGLKNYSLEEPEDIIQGPDPNAPPPPPPPGPQGHPGIGAPRPRYSLKIPEPPLFQGNLEHTKLWIQQMKWHFDALSVHYAGHDAGLALSVAVTCLRGNAARWFQCLCATG